MAKVMTVEEYAKRSGADLASLRAAIEEARSGSITKESMDRSTLTERNISAATVHYMREYLRNAHA